MALRDFYKSYISKNVDKNELNKELLYNLYKTPKRDKGLDAPHQTNDVENAVHQMDLLYLPDDAGRKYSLVVVDLATRKTDAEPMMDKKPQNVVEALKAIYNRRILKPPKIMEVDAGSEFKGALSNYLKSKNIFMRVKKKARHRAQASVEQRNQVIGKALHMSEAAQEILTGRTSKKWVRTLPSVIRRVNEMLTKEVKPINGIPQIPKGKNSELLKEGTKVRIILEHPKEIPTGKKLHGNFRKSDIRWEREPTKIKQILFQPQQPIMYLVESDPTTAYTRNQLQVVPQNERLPPRSVLNR